MCAKCRRLSVSSGRPATRQQAAIHRSLAPAGRPIASLWAAIRPQVRATSAAYGRTSGGIASQALELPQPPWTPGGPASPFEQFADRHERDAQRLALGKVGERRREVAPLHAGGAVGVEDEVPHPVAGLGLVTERSRARDA
jgi:hypothetical protein